MIVRRIYPEPGEPLSLDSPDGRNALAALYEPGAAEWIRLNLVSTIAGSVVGSDGTSETLSNPVDRKILGTIRRASDVVLVGASSFRAEGYQLPKTVPLAVVTASGDLSGHKLRPDAEGRLLVLCPGGVVDVVHASLGGLRATVIEVAGSQGSLSASAITAALRRLGFARIVCEGGPALAAQLVDAGLVNEICISTSAQIGGPMLPLLGTATTVTRPLTLNQLLVDDASTLYARWMLA